MTVRLGLVGAGLVGRRHAEAIRQSVHAQLAAVTDPSEAALAPHCEEGVTTFADLDALISAGSVDGLILATPNRLHAAQARDAIRAGLPCLVEKPFTDDLDEGEAVLDAAETAGVPLLTGHHRRYNPIVERARALIEEGALGQITAVQSSCWLKKPDEYFAPDWRRKPGGGPVLVNLIHDVDLLRHFCGDVASVQAMTAHAARGFAVEDTAACLLRFTSGALATMTVSDAIPAPVSWELTARENPAYPATDQSCYWIGGTTGTLSVPDLSFWHHTGNGGWWSPMTATRFPVEAQDPLVAQIEHFAAVIRGEAVPRVSGRDGLEAVRIINAIHRSAEAGQPVDLHPKTPDVSTSQGPQV